MRLSLVAFALLLPGCYTSSLLLTPGKSNSQYAPINEKDRLGIVRYLNQGTPAAVAGRRESAYQTMYETCGGPYEIVSEDVQSSDAVAFRVSDAVSISDEEQYLYIKFKCSGNNSEERAPERARNIPFPPPP